MIKYVIQRKEDGRFVSTNYDNGYLVDAYFGDTPDLFSETEHALAVLADVVEHENEADKRYSWRAKKGGHKVEDFEVKKVEITVLGPENE